MKKGLIVFLNGTSSSGKTSISNSLMNSSNMKFMHLSIDEVSMGIFQSYGKWLNTKFPHMGEVSEENSQKFATIVTNSIISLYHSTIKGFSEIGINVIVDHVAGENKDWLFECTKLLDGYPVIFVGVRCSLNELERREKSRGDRKIGLARSQYESIHSFGNYDIEVNTDEMNPQECADLILEEINNTKEFKAFQKLKIIIEGNS